MQHTEQSKRNIYFHQPDNTIQQDNLKPQAKQKGFGENKVDIMGRASQPRVQSQKRFRWKL